jgi:hypothetical protein
MINYETGRAWRDKVEAGQAVSNARVGQIWRRRRRTGGSQDEYRIDKIHSLKIFDCGHRSVHDDGYTEWTIHEGYSSLTHMCDSGDFHLVYDPEGP